MFIAERQDYEPFSPKVQFFKCNDLVTENCLFVSLIDFRLSKLYHYITKVHFPIYNSKL